MKSPMVWNGKELTGYAEIIDTALRLPPEEQARFVEEYAKTGPYALQNVGYFSGYYDGEMAARIQEVFKTAHPIFGRRTPSSEEAYEAGVALGLAAKKRGPK